MKGIERAVAFECPLCHGPKQLYISVDFTGPDVTCPNCNAIIQISEEWKRQIEVYKAISKGN